MDAPLQWNDEIVEGLSEAPTLAPTRAGRRTDVYGAPAPVDALLSIVVIEGKEASVYERER